MLAIGDLLGEMALSGECTYKRRDGCTFTKFTEQNGYLTLSLKKKRYTLNLAHALHNTISLNIQ